MDFRSGFNIWDESRWILGACWRLLEPVGHVTSTSKPTNRRRRKSLIIVRLMQIYFGIKCDPVTLPLVNYVQWGVIPWFSAELQCGGCNDSASCVSGLADQSPSISDILPDMKLTDRDNLTYIQQATSRMTYSKRLHKGLCRESTNMTATAKCRAHL